MRFIVMSRRLVLVKLSTVAFMFASMASAGRIVQWNQDNVQPNPGETDGTYTEGQTYFSPVLNGDGTSYGSVFWTQGSVEAPGMQVVTDGSGEESCIMTSGFLDGSTKQCDDPQQTSKRVKVGAQDLSGPIDLVFDVDEEDPVDNVYRFFLKYENLSTCRIGSFKLQLGTGIGSSFVASEEDDGLSFATRDGTVVTDATSFTGNDLATFFAFGLFGDAETSFHANDGYYDPYARGRFNMEVTDEDELVAVSVSSNVADLYGGAMQSWIHKGIAPTGYFWDEDNDPNTEAVLVADFDASGNGWQGRRLCSDLLIQNLLTDSLIRNDECRESSTEDPKPLSEETLEAWGANALFFHDLIEDFGNVNINTHIKITDAFTDESDTFTVRLLPEEDDCNLGAPWNGDTPGGGGTVSGDPHFTRWKNENRDSFHGECDLVFLHHDNINEKEFDVHVRTTIRDSYSYVSGVAIQHGDDKAEFHHDTMYVNGDQPEDETRVVFGRNMITLNDDDKRKFSVNIGDKLTLRVHSTKHFMGVTVEDTRVLMGSTGILGDYRNGDMIARDGTKMEDFMDFGFEWQVSPADPQIFMEAREPQLPYERCRMPSVSAESRRHRKLRGKDHELYEQAVAACTENHIPANIPSCIDDVMFTGELDLAFEM